MNKAVYPGTFDPITIGHLDIIERASKLVDKLYIVVAHNVHKKTFFTPDERIDLIKKVTKHLKNIVVLSTQELIVRFAHENNIELIIRGMRNFQDYENEYTLHQFNKNLNSDIETLVMFPSARNQFVSSSAIKELVYHKADISLYIPKEIVEKVEKRILDYFSLKEKV